MLHELREILIDDFGAVEALVTGGDGTDGHDGYVSRLRRVARWRIKNQ
jgi:hypothetical protein